MLVRCIAGVSKERAEIALKMEAVFSFETLARDPWWVWWCEMYCWRFEGACWNSPEDGGSVFLRNFSKRPEFHGLSTPQNMPMWQQMKFFLVYSKALSASPRGGIGGKVTGEWWIWKSLEANCRSITEVHASLFYALFALMFLTVTTPFCFTPFLL